MPRGNYYQERRRKNIEQVEKWVKEAGGKDHIKMGNLIQKTMDELGCTRRKAIEYIDVATS